MKNDIEKLTGMASKSYHGNMTENGDKLPEKTPFEKERIDKVTKPQIFESKASGQVKDAQEEAREQKSKISAEQEAALRNKAEVGERARREEQLRREHADMIKRIMLKHEGSEEEKGILGLLLDILISALTGIGEKIDEEELGKKMEKSEAMQAVRAYMRIRPKNLWKGEDYARVVFMLKPDESREANILKETFRDEVKGETEDVYSNKLIELDRGGLERLKGGGSKNIDEEIIDRRTQAHADLREEMKASGELSKLSTGKINALAIEAGGISGGSGPREKESKGDKNEMPPDVKREKERQERLKKGKEAFEKDFSSEDQLKIKAWVESGDPKSFEKAIKIFEKYEGDPRTLKKAAESYLRDYEFNVEHGLKPSENAEKFADLMKDVLFNLDISGGSGPTNARDEIEGEEIHDNKQDNPSDQGKNVEEGKAKSREGANSSTEAEKNKEGPTVGGKTREEVYKAVIGTYENSKELPKILARLDKMYIELESLNKKMDHLIGINGTYMTMYMRDPQTFKKNYDRYQKEYEPIREREIAIQSKIEELSGAERRVLGGERDKELYIGTIDHALEERMNRIEYLIKKRQNPKDGSLDPNREDLRDFPSDINDPKVLNPMEPGIADEERVRRGLFLEKVKEKAFLKKMPRVYEQFEKEGILAKKEGQYFKELQRWAGVIIKNVDEGRLQMPADVYKEFKRIKGVKSNVYEYADKKEFEDIILDTVSELKGEKKTEKGKYLRFLDYFRHDDLRGNDSYLNLEGKGFTPEGQISPESYGYPSSLEASMLLMAEDREMEEWQTGGKYELVDAEGKFHRKNFLLWMDKMFNIQTDWDPNVKIDFQRGTQFKSGFSYITLADILFLPQYTRHQEYEIRGDASKWYSKSDIEKGEGGRPEGVVGLVAAEEQGGEQGNGHLERRWGTAKEHPEMPYKVRVDKMLVNAWKLGIEHNDWVDLNDNKVRWDTGAWVAKNGEIANLNNYTRAGQPFQSVMLPSHKGDEVEKYFNEDEQGDYGRAVNAGILAHRYLAEFTKYYTKKENGKTIEVNKKDNMFYQALGNDGASIFLKTLAEGAFDQVDETVFEEGQGGARTKIKEAYKKFILNRVEDIEKDNAYNSLQGEQKGKMDLLIKNFRDEFNGLKGAKLDDLKIGLDRYDKLIKLKLDIESRVMNRGIVNEEDKKSYDPSKVVAREEIERQIAKLMRENIGEFFKDVKSIEIPHVPEKKSGEKEKVDLSRKVKIEELKVYTDANGRIVTEAEWEQMPVNRRGEKSVGNIMDEFGENFVDYGDKLEKFGKAVREYERAIGEGESTVAAEKEINDLDPKCEEILKLYEALGLAMVTKVANISRNELNRFNTTRPRGGTSTGDIPIMKNAFKKSLASIYGLNEIEEESVYNRVFYPLERLDIASFNNTSGVPGGIEQGSWFNRFMEARNARMDMQEFAGSKATLTQLPALRLPTALERWRVRYPGEGKPEHMLIEVLQGGKGREMEKRWKRRLKNNPTAHYEMAGNEEQADFGDGLAKTDVLRKLIVEDREMEFDKIVYMDNWGVERVHHESAIKIFDAWWNSTRLNFNSHGIDFDAKIAVDGRDPTVMEHLFGKDIRRTHKIMMEYYEEYSNKLDREGKPEDAKAYRELAEDLKTKPAMAAFLDMVTTSIHEHREFGGTYNQWSAQTVAQIWWAMNSFLHKRGEIEMHGNEAKTGEKPSMVPYELFNRLRGVHKDSAEKDVCWDFFLAFVAGFLEGVTGTWVEFKDELALIQKTPPLSA